MLHFSAVILENGFFSVEAVNEAAREILDCAVMSPIEFCVFSSNLSAQIDIY